MKANGIKCFVSKSNGGPVTCDMPQAYEKSLNQISKAAKAGDNAAASKMVNFTKAVRGAGKVINATLGPAALAFEAGFAVPIGLFEYAQGKPADEIVDTLTYGLVGKSKEDKLKETIPNYQEFQDLDKAFTGFRGSLNKLGMPRDPNNLRPGKGTDELYKNFVEKQKPFMQETVPPSLGFKDFDLDMYDQTKKAIEEAKEKFASEDLERAENRKTPFSFDYDEMANGGIAGLSGGDKSGPAPESGPTPHGEEGLQGLFNRVKKA